MRTRQYRARKREGAVLVQLCIAPKRAQLLQRLGWLAPGDAGNPTAIAEAVLALGSAALTKGLSIAQAAVGGVGFRPLSARGALAPEKGRGVPLLRARRAPGPATGVL